jgi:hypothetical protein
VTIGVPATDVTDAGLDHCGSCPSARHRYKGLSLSRKAFRCLRSLADLVTAAGKAAVISAKPVPGVLGTVQWLLMSVHIFWDNMFFCTHPIVVRRSRPSCLRAFVAAYPLTPLVYRVYLHAGTH